MLSASGSDDLQVKAMLALPLTILFLHPRPLRCSTSPALDLPSLGSHRRISVHFEAEMAEKLPPLPVTLTGARKELTQRRERGQTVCM